MCSLIASLFFLIVSINFSILDERFASLASEDMGVVGFERGCLVVVCVMFREKGSTLLA